MPREQFIDKEFRDGSLAMIQQANEIIVEYQEQGFTLTLRQLYYQFVARALIPNRQSEYKRLGSIINDGRLAGLIDWEAIEDRTRNLQTHASWDDPEDIIAACADSFRLDLWEGQPYRPEVWIEKEALIGVIEPVCRRFRIPYFACRGYSSQSEQWRAGRRFRRVKRRGADPVVFHLGDHDPSGIDMTRDNDARLSMFAGFPVRVERLALNYAQVEEYGPPPNPAKETDSRASGYMARYGDQSWELDALDPPVIDALISNAVEALIDREVWDEREREEEAAREQLGLASREWDRVVEFLGEEEA